MEFTPDYTVSYRGVFHRAGTPFDIDEEDYAEMSRHGRVAPPKEAADQPPMESPRRGRPPKK